MAQQVSPSNPLQVKSLEKWKRVFQDELDMTENEEFLVLKTSMCGWWYAINKNQEDGLIPYMYLEILSDYVDYTQITQHEFSHIEKTVLGWDIHNVCKLVFQDQKSTTQEQNILLHSLRNLYIMCQKQDCRYTFLSKGGLDRLHDILQKTFDIAIRTFCLRAMILLAPSIEARRFPAQCNLTEGILGVMKEYMDMPSFVCICTDALSNVAFQNERQRMLASKTNAVEMLLYCMDRHQTVFKVQLQASRSLANMVSDPKIQRQIDDKGVQTLLNSLNNVFGQDAVNNAIQKQQNQDMNQNGQQNQGQGGAMFDAKKGQFGQQMLTILSYLVTDPRKAQAFGRLGGWQCVKTIQNAIGVWDEAVRSTIVGMLNSMSQNPAIAKCFFDNNYEGYDILFDMCLEAEPYSLYFYQVFSVITFISCKCDKQQLPQVIMRAFDRKQLARLMNDALQQTDNERLMDTVPTMCALTARTKHPDALQYIYNSMVPMHLLKICGTQPGPPNDQFLNYTLITIYNLTDDPERVDSFIQNGVIEAIALSEWYKDPHKDPHVVQNGIASLINVCSKSRRKLLPQQEQAIANLIQICFQVHPKLKPLVQKLEVALKKAQQLSGSKQKKQRNARNKRNKNGGNNNNGQMQGSYDPRTGSYQGQNNAQKPANYNPNQQNPNQQNQNQNNFQGPVQSGLIERPYHDADQNNQNNNQQQQAYGSQNNFGNNPNNQQQQQQYGSQMNFGGNQQPPQQQQPYGSQMNFGNNQQQNNYNNQPPPQQQQQQQAYGSQMNFGGNQNPNNQNPNNQNPYQSQQNFGNPNQNQNQKQNPYQSQSNFNNNRNQNPYQSQQNFGNPNMANNNNNNNLGNNMGQGQGQAQKQESLYGKDKWDTDSDDDPNNPNDSSSEDEWEKQKKAKVAASAHIGGNNNQNQNQNQNNWNPQPPQNQNQNQNQAQQQYGSQAPPQQQQAYGSQMNFNNQQGGYNQAPPNQQYGAPQGGGGGNQNSAFNDSSDDDVQANNNQQGWGQAQQQQQQNPSGMSKQSVSNWNNQAPQQQRDYMGFNQMQQRQDGGYQGGPQGQQMQQQQQQPQQQADKGKKGKKKKKFKLFG